MRLLNIRAEGLPLYKTPFEVSFFAAQRVERSHLDAVSKLFNNIYVNKAEAFIGINASGKTTALNVTAFACLLASGVSLNSDFPPQMQHLIKENRTAVFHIHFFSDKTLYYLQSELTKVKNASGKYEIKILAEHLWVKRDSSKVNKQNLLDFGSAKLLDQRTDDNKYLPDDVSIAISLRKQGARRQGVALAYLSAFTLPDVFTPYDSVPAEIISLLDPTVEYLSEEQVNERSVIRLKFFGQEERVLADRSELGVYLSSGTLKGVTVFSQAIEILKRGGYLILDEIENHFNRELVTALLRLFLDGQTNPNGAVLIFSTHYSELLDALERNDSVFITRYCDGLTVDNLNDLLTRNDFKRSDVYQSNYLGGTAPKYTSLEALRKRVIRSLEG